MTCQRRNSVTDHGSAERANTIAVPQTPGKQAERALAPGHWAVLNILEGSLRFTNLQTNEARLISAPNHVTIHPGLPHKVATEGPLRCGIDFCRKPPTSGGRSQVRGSTSA